MAAKLAKDLTRSLGIEFFSPHCAQIAFDKDSTMKCFLSHSSSDKGHYVSVVARKLGPNVEYDEKTFEEGMGNLEEILKAMHRSEVFVFFISNASLDSDWVKREILEAKTLLKNGDLKRFFPIIIEAGLTHKDSRIPDWIRNTYNLKPITRPVVAAKRIRERMIEASWQSHPMLKERDQIFVGRNSHISEFEQRFDDFNKDQPLIVFASGLREIGRKSTMRFALRKANLVRDTYEPIRVDLSQEDNIEGFIVKLYDIGLSENANTHDLMKKTAEEKHGLCASLLQDIFNADELLTIEDHYCIVRFDKEIAPWFLSVVDLLKHDSLGVCVASSAKAAKYKYLRDDRLYFMEIPELQKKESEGLFKRYTEYLNLGLNREDFRNFAPLLKGFPEQVTYAANLIQGLGCYQAFQKADEIVSFSTFKASIFIKKYEDDEAALSFLRFISSFDFVSLDFIASVAESLNCPLTDTLDRFVTDSVCETIGSTGQYFRVNEVIRDAIIRDRTELSNDYRSFLRKFVSKFSNDYDDEYYDVSEYHVAIKEALSSGVELPESLLIPAHFLKTMKELYNSGSHREVVSLADRVLMRAEYYDAHTSQDIRYYLCQSLARLREPRFTAEVQNIDGPEHDFLFGFYYRLKGQFDKAVDRYERAMKFTRTEQRARRELVFVMTTVEAYEDALSLARENYERYPSNPFIVQAYFDCLIHTSSEPDCANKLQEVLDSLEQIRGARAVEMFGTLSAKYEYHFGDKKKSFKMIDDSIRAHVGVVYPVLTALDMAMSEMDPEGISICIKRLESGRLGSGHKLAILKAKILLTALNGDKARAERMIERDLGQMNPKASDKLLRRVRAA